MNAPRALLVVALLAVTACASKKDKDKDDGARSAEPGGSAPPPATVAPAAPPPPAIEQHVKVELDNRADGGTGAPLSVPGALALLYMPSGWAPVKGEFTLLSPADKKAQLALAAIPASETADAKLPGAVAALGLH